MEEDFAVYMSPSGRQHKFPGYNQSRCDDLAAVIREEINERWERMKSRHIIEKNRIEYETISKTPKNRIEYETIVSVVLWWMCHARRSRAPGGPSHCEERMVSWK